MTLSLEQIGVIVAVERAGAILSIVGIVVVLVSFWLFKRLRTVPNLFILYASFANAGASVACVIGYDGLKSGVESSLCQTQAFLLEMFMQSDPFWSLAMAINVFLVFFFGASPSTFPKYQLIYCLLCYGLPALPAITLVFVRTDDLGRAYGDAALWCWIGPKWSFLRIWAYYIPVWICSLLSFMIYFAVGYHVFHQRNQLLNLTIGKPDRDDQATPRDGHRKSSSKVGMAYHTWEIPLLISLADLTVTTEVHIVTTQNIDHSGFCTLKSLPPAPPAINASSHLERWNHAQKYPETSAIVSPNAAIETTCVSTSAISAFRKSQSNRSLVGQLREKVRRLDPVKVAYLRTSFIFAISVLVTWIPSSVNRIHDLVHPEEIHFGLSVTSAAVLPLQGVWNAIIFFTTSWDIVKEEVLEMWPQLRGTEKTEDVLPRIHLDLNLGNDQYLNMFCGSRLMRSVSQDDVNACDRRDGCFIETV
ncbi:hypothetical protein TD95_005190 [Thielaviopsis punctulata]|uniref:G-protein coupled receptors family 2 profile 2 domain-containing protein n=1 Tax=Thielaviopsis punctulata TaxID=72032 RepID=A0A0F4ZGY7_9PEZI|nr:hypothetical protein TD95_005190 [Thielaviopsis punctulata]